MSDDTTPTEEGPRNKQKPEQSDFEKETAKGPVSPANERIFDFIDGLFADEGNFPELLDCREVHGRHYDIMGDPVRKYNFKGRAKPTREELVQLANTLLLRIQADCDIRQRETMYQIAAWHPARSDEFYERVLYRCKPKNTWKLRGGEHGVSGGAGSNGHDDEDASFPEKYNRAFLDHTVQSNELIHGMVMGLLDRSDRQAASYAEENARLRSTVMQQFDIIQRLQAMEDERMEKRQWLELKRKGAEKAMELGMLLAPPIVNKLAGKEVVPEQKNSHGVADSLAALTLRNFFKTTDEGGSLTPELLDALMGKFDKDDKLVKPGVLNFDQGKVLFAVAQCQAPEDALDLVLPGGQFEINEEQLGKLIALTQQGLPPEQLMAIKMIFEERLAKRQDGGKK